jgi:hypothetical protein
VPNNFHYYPPAKTFDEPAATEVQVGSPTLPACLLLTYTVDEPDDIGAAWPGQIGAGKR